MKFEDYLEEFKHIGICIYKSWPESRQIEIKNDYLDYCEYTGEEVEEQ